MASKHPGDAQLHFAATAYQREPGCEEREISTPPGDFAELLAAGPLGAARTWYWRLAEAERAACRLVVVRPWTGDNRFGYRVYGGPAVAYSPKDNWREVWAGGAAPSICQLPWSRSARARARS